MTGVLGGIIGSMKGATAPKTAPTSLSAVASTTSVAISFTAPSDDGGSAITNYQYSFNNSTWTALSPADAISPITISGLSGYVSYNVYLRAVNIIGFGPASSVVSFTTFAAPTATINAVTNFDQSRGTFNTTVSANGSSTTVYFQFNTTNNFASYSQVTAGTVTTQSAGVAYTQTGLSTNGGLNAGGVTYYVRSVAVNSAGTTTSGVTSFQTWGVREYNQRAVGTHYPVVPTIPGVVPGALPSVYLIGSGGGGGYWGAGGGAGGYVARFNVAFTGTSGALTVVVGAPGGGGTNPGAGATGGAAQFAGTNFPYHAAGGGTGGAGVNTDGPGGNVGGGDNPAYVGGSTAVVVSGKNTYRYSGGGAGNDAHGGNGVNGASGNGGNGNGFWGNSGGGGGADGNGANGSPYNIGAGGHGGATFSDGAAGIVGIVYFTYYGP